MLASVGDLFLGCFIPIVLFGAGMILFLAAGALIEWIRWRRT